MKNSDRLSQAIYYQLADLYEISAIYHHNKRLIFRTKARGDSDRAGITAQQRLQKAGFDCIIKEDEHGHLISVGELPLKRRIPRLNIILFLATIVTVFLAPVIDDWNFKQLNDSNFIYGRVEFTVFLMTILLFHEFGHYLAGRRRGVLMSLPYFIPAPNFVGTFGALIKSRSPFTCRRDLIEVGAAGPIAGFVVSVIALIIGLYGTQAMVPAGDGLTFGDSLLIKSLARIIVGPIPEGYDYALSPAGFAGWVGLFVTMLNMLPIGQLDGGHIIYGLAGRYQHRIARIFIVIMMILGFWWHGWWLLGILILLVGINHPPTLDNEKPLSPVSKAMGIAALIIFIICFLPVPFQM